MSGLADHASLSGGSFMSANTIKKPLRRFVKKVHRRNLSINRPHCFCLVDVGGLLVTTKDTDPRMMQMERICIQDNDSPKAIRPIKSAVTGSIAPKMAVFDGPIYLIAIAINRNENNDGKNASPKAQPMQNKSGSLCKFRPHFNAIRKTGNPNSIA